MEYKINLTEKEDKVLKLACNIIGADPETFLNHILRIELDGTINDLANGELLSLMPIAENFRKLIIMHENMKT